MKPLLHFRHVLIGCVALAAFNSVGQAAQVYQRAGNIKTSVLDRVTPQILAKFSNRYRVPSPRDLEVWRRSLANFYAGNLQNAANLISTIAPNYRVIRYTDTSAAPSRLYYLLMEANLTLDSIQPVVDTGWGAYLFDPNPIRAIALQSPHPIADAFTEDEGNEGLLVLRPRGYALFTSHRCASNSFSAQTGSTAACNDPTGFRLSDAPHAALSATPPVTGPYEIAHEELTRLFSVVTIQLHGNGNTSSCPQVFLSNTGGSTLPNGNVAHLQQELIAQGFSAGVAGSNTTCGLTGSNNLQGRKSNGSPNPVTTPAPPPASVETFIHVEQLLTGMRNTPVNRLRVLDAIANITFVVTVELQ